MAETEITLAPWAIPWLTTPSRYKAAHGGRATSKSQSIATLLVEKLSEQPLRWLCCREVQASLAQSSKRTIEDKIAAHGLSDFYKITDTDIRGNNGSMFLFAGLGSDPEKIKSMEGLNGAWVSEANTVSQRSIELLEPTVRESGSELWFDWNPEHETDPVDEMFRGEKGPPPDSIVVEVTRAMNPWFPDVLRAKMEYDRLNYPDKFLHIWDGGYRRIGKETVFTNWTKADFETPGDARLYFGADWGFSVDPTVLTRSFVGWFKDEVAIADPEGDCLFVDGEAYQVGCAIDAHPALFDQVPGSRKWPIIADSARPEMIHKLSGEGFNISAARKGPGSVEQGISSLQDFRIIVHPRCAHVENELTRMAWKRDRKTNAILPVLVPKHDHCIDSLRYAHQDTRRSFKVASVVGGTRTNLVDMWGGQGGGELGSMWG